ncbi:trypsin Inhibitor like cysteine rich domain protein, partial [Ancylostoma caninum]
LFRCWHPSYIPLSNLRKEVNGYLNSSAEESLIFQREDSGAKFARKRIQDEPDTGACARANCGEGWRCVAIEGKARCLPTPNPCDTFQCASDEDCVLDHGLPYCQKKISNCPQNETRQECGSLCEGLCLVTVLGNLTCGVPDVCAWPSCACNEGYYRDALGHCVMEQDCFPDAACFASPPPCKETEACSVEDGKVICIPALICGENEEYNDCGNSCEPKCDGIFKKKTKCLKKCTTPACVCKRGYYRQASGECVRKRRCRRRSEARKPLGKKKDMMTAYGDEPITGYKMKAFTKATRRLSQGFSEKVVV